MNLVPEKFKIIPATYNGNDFMKIQYEDKDLVMKLKGEFHIIDVKKYGLRLIFTPDNNEIIDKIYELGCYKNKSELRRNPLGKRVIRTIGGQKSQDALRAQLCLLSQLSRISLSFTMTSGYKQTEMERRRHLLRMYGEKK